MGGGDDPRRTNSSLSLSSLKKKVASFKVSRSNTLHETSSSRSNLQEHFIISYLLPQDKLQKYLETVFPELRGQLEPKFRNDRWIVSLPRKLTEEEKVEIDDLRESKSTARLNLTSSPVEGDEDQDDFNHGSTRTAA